MHNLIFWFDEKIGSKIKSNLDRSDKWQFQKVFQRPDKQYSHFLFIRLLFKLWMFCFIYPLEFEAELTFWNKKCTNSFSVMIYMQGFGFCWYCFKDKTKQNKTKKSVVAINELWMRSHWPENVRLSNRGDRVFYIYFLDLWVFLFTDTEIKV